MSPTSGQTSCPAYAWPIISCLYSLARKISSVNLVCGNRIRRKNFANGSYSLLLLHIALFHYNKCVSVIVVILFSLRNDILKAHTAQTHFKKPQNFVRYLLHKPTAVCAVYCAGVHRLKCTYLVSATVH